MSREWTAARRYVGAYGPRSLAHPSDVLYRTTTAAIVLSPSLGAFEAKKYTLPSISLGSPSRFFYGSRTVSMLRRRSPLRSETMIKARRTIAGYILDAFSNARVYSMCCKRPSWIYKNKPPGLGERLEQHLLDGSNIPLLGSGFYAKQSYMYSDIALGG